MRVRIRVKRWNRKRLAGLVHPLTPAPKTAILGSGFAETRVIRLFPNGWNEEVERFRPTALAGSWEILRPLTLRGIELEHAVIVLHHDPETLLMESERDLLWDAFGVPIFEQLLGPDNRAIAMECDAHNGLHVLKEIAGTELERSACACGSREPRLMQSAPRKLVAVAAGNVTP